MVNEEMLEAQSNERLPIEGDGGAYRIGQIGRTHGVKGELTEEQYDEVLHSVIDHLNRHWWSILGWPTNNN